MAVDDIQIPRFLESSRATRRGIVYVAFGENAREEAAMSIAALRPRYDGLITVISSEPLPGAHFIRFDDPRFGARWAKLNLDLLTPYDQTLYLDADTRPRTDCAQWFEILADGFDVVIAESTMQGQKALWHVDEAEREETLDGFGFTPLQLQAGVFAFRRSEAVVALFAAWREEWRGGQDQAALLRALARAPVKLWVVSHHLSEISVAHVWGRLH